MTSKSRREFLRMAATSAGASAALSILPAGIREALAQPASGGTGTINDVQHIVIFTQENRSFDHYYGTLRGVRGFGDRTAIQLPDGKPVWYQPHVLNVNGYILPFHLDTATTSATCSGTARMDYPTDIAMWNEGRYDAWNSARPPGLGMAYYQRADLEFYYALAEAFTICDDYHCSTFTQTNPNRLHLFSGSNGLSVGQAPTLDNTEPTPGFSWITEAELLEQAGISWKVYQEKDNFDDNGFAWFQSFKSSKPGDALYDKGMAIVPDLVQAFAADVQNGTLPQVSWIVAAANLSEHPDYRPAYGEDLSARLLTALAANPQTWSKTVFFLNYDEQGGFFDHMVPPTPPGSDSEGLSTISTNGEIFTGTFDAQQFVNKPIGLGFRVPMIVVSPWSKGGWVCSEVFDHTSVIRFIEQRFGVVNPNISAWRRAVSGDLTAAFDFSRQDAVWPSLPDTGDYVKNADRECSTLPPPSVPLFQSLPQPEAGTRPSRALPYELHASGLADALDRKFTLLFANTGQAGAVFQVHDLAVSTNAPRRYTVEAGKTLSDSWSGAAYGLSATAPNGFLRQFAGTLQAGGAQPEIRVCYAPSENRIYLNLRNDGSAPCRLTVKANAYRSDGPWIFELPAGGTVEEYWPVLFCGNWYDFSVTTDTDPAFLRRFAGRMENGADSISDPAMSCA